MKWHRIMFWPIYIYTDCCLFMLILEQYTGLNFVTLNIKWNETKRANMLMWTSNKEECFWNIRLHFCWCLMMFDCNYSSQQVCHSPQKLSAFSKNRLLIWTIYFSYSGFISRTKARFVKLDTIVSWYDRCIIQNERSMDGEMGGG